MIRMHNIPEHIRASLNQYYKENEKPDVFPSKFLIEGEKYYYFTCALNPEQLIMRDDGTVPYFQQIKKEALICHSYNASIETIIHIGNKWVKSGKKGKYESLQVTLTALKEKLPPEMASAHHTYVVTADTILKNQAIIDHSVKKATEIWDRTNLEELATEQDQIEMRKYIVDMTRAAYRQNEIQLKTENDRVLIWKYVSSNKWSIGLGLYLNLRTYQKNMMKNTPENIKEAEELGRMVLGDDLPLEQHENAQDVWGRLRNPR